MSFKFDLLCTYWQSKPVMRIDKTLIYASESREPKYERIKILIDSGANPNVHNFRRNTIGETPLMRLCTRNFSKTAKDDAFKAIKFLFATEPIYGCQSSFNLIFQIINNTRYIPVWSY